MASVASTPMGVCVCPRKPMPSPQLAPLPQQGRRGGRGFETKFCIHRIHRMWQEQRASPACWSHENLLCTLTGH